MHIYTHTQACTCVYMYALLGEAVMKLGVRLNQHVFPTLSRAIAAAAPPSATEALELQLEQTPCPQLLSYLLYTYRHIDAQIYRHTDTHTHAHTLRYMYTCTHSVIDVDADTDTDTDIGMHLHI